jgi:EAL domain-containing protein (putative c-di-GMP-specific phosphodiesterase class I)
MTVRAFSRQQANMKATATPFARLAAALKRLLASAMAEPFSALEAPLQGSSESAEEAPARRPQGARHATSAATQGKAKGTAVATSLDLDTARFSKASNDEQAEPGRDGIPARRNRGLSAPPRDTFFESRNITSFERAALESSLRRAIEAEELLLHYQPRMGAMSGHIVGMEALLRWQHPELGLVSPAQFMSLAEETGLIVPIGQWVLRQACKQAADWRQAGLDDLVISVNISPRQFADENLLRDITATLSQTGLDARFLELEITEEALTNDVDRGRKLLVAMQALGIRIAIDNFGTGWSSLATLTRFSIDTLMIDRSLVRDLDIGTESRGLAEAIISMGKALRLRILAEGVETQVQADFLRDTGCDELQGYYYSKPLPAGHFELFACTRRAVPLQPREAAQYG